MHFGINTLLFAALLEKAGRKHGPISRKVLIRTAWSRYAMMGLSGEPARKCWYATAGLVLASVYVLGALRSREFWTDRASVAPLT